MVFGRKEKPTKSYYKDPTPWRHEHKPNVFGQIFEILLVLLICFGLIYLSASYHGYDWSNFGFVKLIKELMLQKQ